MEMEPVQELIEEITRRLDVDGPLSGKPRLVLARHLRRSLDMFDETWADWTVTPREER